MTDQKVINGTDLPVGVHEFKNGGKVTGFKYFTDCRVIPSILEAEKGIDVEYSLCFANVLLKGTVVRPKFMGMPMDYLRGNEMFIGKIVTPDGRECVSAKPPSHGDREVTEYRPNETYHSPLDTNPELPCKQGLHCFTTEKAFKQSGRNIANYWVTHYNKNNEVVEITKLNRDNQVGEKLKYKNGRIVERERTKFYYLDSE